MATDEYGMDDEATSATFDAECDQKCGICNHKLTIVRVGKYQCDWCEQYDDLVEQIAKWLCGEENGSPDVYDRLSIAWQEKYIVISRNLIDKITAYLKIDELYKVFDCASNVVWFANENNTSEYMRAVIEELKEAIESWRAKSVR
jgi:hypothetical protein